MAEDELEGGGRQFGGEVGKAGDRGEELAMEGVEEGSVATGSVEKLGNGAGSPEKGVGGSGGQLGADGFADSRPRAAEDAVGRVGGGSAGAEAEGNVEIAGGKDVAVAGCGHGSVRRWGRVAEDGNGGAEDVDIVGRAMNRLKERRHILASLLWFASG